MVERASDTRTTAPAFIYEGPWGIKLNLMGGLQAGNFVEATVGTNATFQQNFGKIAYYIEGEYLYYSRDWQTLRHRARGTVRGDFTLARLSKDVQLSLPVFASVAYDNILLLEPRLTAGGGLWLDYKPEKGLVYNGFSVFMTGEWERATGLPDQSAARLSVRDLIKVFFNKEKTSYLMLDLFYTPNVANFEDFRASASLGIGAALTNIISLNVSGIFEYDSIPRLAVLKKYDIGAILGLSVKLGPKGDK